MMVAETVNGGVEPPPAKKSRADAKQTLLDHQLRRLRSLRESITEQLTELYFLQAGGNLIEYTTWCKRPAAPQLTAFLEARRPPSPSSEPPAVASGGANEGVVAKARAEAWVAARVNELLRSGLWSERRLPRVMEPPRPKTHWDYLLEEMVWLSQDFAHERKWKKQAAKKCAKAVQKYFQDKAQAAQKAERAHEMHLKKLAAFAAKEIRTFWTNVQKLVDWKRDRRIERIRKEALDEKLSYVVGRTEKYSRQLAAGLTGDGSDYSADEDSADDEDTIAEQERAERTNHDEELDDLRKEAEQDLEELLKGYMGAPTPADTDTDTDGESDDNDTAVGVEAGGAEGAAAALSAAAASLQPLGTTLDATPEATPAPALLRHTLREYQHVGLHWLVTMHARALNGILADEMGLGKTIQSIALLAHLAERGDWGPHLIVAPTSVLLNWEMELKKWCPAFKVLTYYGGIKERKAKRVGWTKPNAFHVCITSYKLVVQDHQSFRRKRWKYLILDEAQNIKNFKSQRWQTLLNFQSERRLLLTGTPLQNSLGELWSLMHFLMPEVFASAQEFREWFAGVGALVESGGDAGGDLLRRLHDVLRPFLLRRLKADVEKQLPRKHEHVLLCRLAKRQRALYDDYMSRAKTKESLSSGNLLSVINVLMQLRKVCNHPDLFEPREVESPLQLPPLKLMAPRLIWDMISPPLISLGLATLESIGVGAFEAHRTRHLSATPRLSAPPPPFTPPSKLRLHLRLVPRTPTHVQATPIHAKLTHATHNPQTKESEATVEESDCRSSVARVERRRRETLSRLAEENERRCWAMPLYGEDLRRALALPDANCSLTLPTHLEQMTPLLERVAVRCARVLAPPPSPAPPFATALRQSRLSAAAIASLRPLHSAVHSVRLRQQVSFPHPSLLQFDCGKLQCLSRLLRRLKSGGHRVLIFTQMTKVLDVLEGFLSRLGHTYLRLDGSTRVDRRQHLVDRFNGDVRVFCLILSTRSGGVGLNLVGADCVVFYDSDWNPTMDAQAQDRCHRIGQTRDVHVYRLVTASTVEENILRKADQKRALSRLAIERGRFTVADLLLDAAERPELEQALAAAEDEADAVAAASATAATDDQRKRDAQEFDEEEHVERERDDDEPQDQELNSLMKQLSGVERFAMRVVESSEEFTLAVESAMVAARGAPLSAPSPPSSPDVITTYSASDGRVQVWESWGTQAQNMPIWSPPTPPRGSGDLYIERWSKSLYRSGAAPDHALPATRTAAAPRRVARIAARAHRPAPPSLFERSRPQAPRARPAPSVPAPHHSALEWSSAEDNALRRALRLQRLPNATPAPAHTPNWEWCSELVGEMKRAYRTPRACRDRHERLADAARRKPRRAFARESTPQAPLAKMEALRSAHERRRGAPRRRAEEPRADPARHRALLAEHGLDYDAPPTPVDVATRRADRIAKEKQKAAPATQTPRVVVAHPAASAAPALHLYRQQAIARQHLKILHQPQPQMAPASGAQTPVRRAAPARAHVVLATIATQPPHDRNTQ